MSIRTPSLQPRSLYGAYWGVFATTLLLPNAASAPLAAAQFVLEAGDVAFVTGGMLYVCTSPGTVGGADATWLALGGGAAGASYLTGATNEESVTPTVEVVVGGFVFDPTDSPGRGVYFRGFETTVYTSGPTPTSRVRLYDRGAPGTPTAGTLVSELLNAGIVNVPYTLIDGPFSTDPTTPSLGTIVDALRMYEIRIIYTEADSMLVRWAGLEIR